MISDDASHLLELYRLACDIGPKIEHCRRTGQLSCAVHLNAARESLHKAIHNYKPGVDERQLSLEMERSAK